MKTSINDTFQDWSRKGMIGKKNYEAVFPFKTGYILRSEEGREHIKEWMIIVWNKDEVVFQQQWKQEGCESDLKAGFVIKNQRKMLLYDGEETIYSFGVENKTDDEEEALIYYQSDLTATLVMASTAYPRIRMLDYVLGEDKADVVAAVMRIVLETAKEAQKDSERGGENNESESE